MQTWLKRHPIYKAVDYENMFLVITEYEGGKKSYNIFFCWQENKKYNHPNGKPQLIIIYLSSEDREKKRDTIKENEDYDTKKY